MSYIRGRWANGDCNLLDYLNQNGIRAQVGYNSNARERNNTLIVHFERGDVSKVPSEWNGFHVEVEEVKTGR